MGNEETIYYGIVRGKMKIPENIYNMLVEWQYALELKTDCITGFKLHMLNDEVHEWASDVTTLSDNHNRYIAILQWLDGDDVFEVEKPKKWVVRSKKVDGVNARYYIVASHDMTWFSTTVAKEVATVFDTEEEAKRYANDLMEVVETNE